jgi:hypothetical protein
MRCMVGIYIFWILETGISDLGCDVKHWWGLWLGFSWMRECEDVGDGVRMRSCIAVTLGVGSSVMGFHW